MIEDVRWLTIGSGAEAIHSACRQYESITGSQPTQEKAHFLTLIALGTNEAC
jgi:hypothetical protein